MEVTKVMACYKLKRSKYKVSKTVKKKTNL